MFEEMKNEIRRAYNVLGTIWGEIQNDRDINSWEKRGEITANEAAELRKYNLELSHG